jgi:NADH:ubiquinone oxidoreductase subunit H
MSPLFTFIYWAFVSLAILVTIPSGLTSYFERKFIGIAQRRLGVTFLGRNGWIHLPADIIKFWSKTLFKNNSIWSFTWMNAFFLSLLYHFWSLMGITFFLNNGSTTSCNFFSYQFPCYIGYANLTTLYLFYLVYSIRSKYAMLGCLRLSIASFSLEFPLFANITILLLYCGGYNFDDLAQENPWYYLPLSLPIVCFTLIVHCLYEIKRAPFDHAEAEPELVAGHILEFPGKTPLFYFLSEYLHLYFCISIFLMIFSGDEDDLHWTLSFFQNDEFENFYVPIRTNFLGDSKFIMKLMYEDGTW